MINQAARLLRAAAPQPPRCLGLQLRPYSLGHDIILHALDNAFTQGRRDINDLLIGVFICSQSYRDWERASKSIWLPVFLKVWGWFIRKRDFRVESEIFEQYLLAGNDCPDVNQNVSAEQRELAMPWQERLKVMLMVKLHLTEQEALDRPLALSNMDWCCLGELDGTINLFNNRDEAFLDFHKKRMAEDQRN